MNGLLDSQENGNIEYFDYADNVDKILLDDTSTTNFNATIRFNSTTMVDNPDPVLIEMTEDNPITNEPLIKCHEIVPLENTILDISKVQHIEPISAGSLLNIQVIFAINLSKSAKSTTCFNSRILAMRICLMTLNNNASN